MKIRIKVPCAAVLLLAIFFVMYGLNSMTPPTLSDDVLYKCVWKMDETMEQRPIETFGDIVESQTAHYKVVNGRIVVHTVAQLFIGILGKDVFNVFNSLFFCFLIWCCVLFAVDVNIRSTGDLYRGRSNVSNMQKYEHTNIFMPLLLSTFLIFVLIPGFQDAFLWFVGSFNYLWTALAVLLFIMYFYRVERQAVGWKSFAVCPLAMLAGWTHEGLTLPLSIGFVLWMTVNRRRIFHSAALPAVLCFMAGTALSAFSPGTLGRAGANTAPLLDRMLLGIFNYLVFVRISWLLLVAVVVAWFCRRDVLKEEIRRNYVLYFAMLMSLGIVLVCGQTEARVCFHADFIALLLLVSLLVRSGVFVADGYSYSFAYRKSRILAVGMCAVMTAIAIPVFKLAAVNKNDYDFQLKQQQTEGVQLIRVRHLPDSGSRLFDMLMARYVKPSVEFGFYSCYQGFDADDVNLRCAAAVYGKPRMMYLPEDIAAKLEKGHVTGNIDVDGVVSSDNADNTSSAVITGFCSDRYDEISVMRIPDGLRVMSLSFVLRPSRFDEMPFYRRLFAYKGERYELPYIKFKTVDVFGHTYLFFANPPGGIRDFIEETRITFDS